MNIVFATKNMGKLKEAKALLAGTGIEIISLTDFGDIPDVIEDGDTFFANAYKKARIVAELTNCVTLADDSGLEVDYLHGAPGVQSARYAGSPSSDERNMAKLLASLHGVPQEKRQAAFICCLVLYKQPDDFIVFEGRLDGEIYQHKLGNAGFGYDPILYLPKKRCTVAQLSLDEKKQIVAPCARL